MYCINCRYYNKNNRHCLNRDGLINRELKECDFCSYCEPITDVEFSCENCAYYKNEVDGTGFCTNFKGLYHCVFKSDYCSSFKFSERTQTSKKENEKPKLGWLYKNEEIGYIILEKINERGLCEAYNYDERGNKLTYTLGINSLGEPIFQVFKEIK